MTIHKNLKVPPTRHQNNVLAVHERKLLTWLCARLPKPVTPDSLTLMAFISAAIVGAAYWLSNYGSGWLWLAVAGYVGHWFGDSLDGSLARFRKIERPSYGYFIDHSSDGLTTLMMLGGFGLSPYVRVDVALFAVAAYLLLSIHSFLLAKVSGDFPMSHAGMGPTEARILLIALTIGMYFFGVEQPVIAQFSAFDIIFMILTSVLLLMFIIGTARAGRMLARRDHAERNSHRETVVK